MSFYKTIAKYYDGIFPLKPSQVGFTRAVTGDNKKILDMGCATGAFAAEMAKTSDMVRAFDLDTDMINIAAAKYAADNLIYRTGSIVDIDTMYKDDKFDAVTCFGNTLVHLNSDEILRALSLVKTLLKPDGLFIFQILNYRYIFNMNIINLPLIDNDIIRFDRTNNLKSRYVIDFITKLTIKETCETIDNTIMLYPIYIDELQQKLEICGFNTMSFYKDYNMAKYDDEHLPLIAVVK